nr:hypothetical protein [Nocardioides daeguensis]
MGDREAVVGPGDHHVAGCGEPCQHLPSYGGPPGPARVTTHVQHGAPDPGRVGAGEGPREQRGQVGVEEGRGVTARTGAGVRDDRLQRRPPLRRRLHREEGVERGRDAPVPAKVAQVRDDGQERGAVLCHARRGLDENQARDPVRTGDGELESDGRGVGVAEHVGSADAELVEQAHAVGGIGRDRRHGVRRRAAGVPAAVQDEPTVAGQVGLQCEREQLVGGQPGLDHQYGWAVAEVAHLEAGGHGPSCHVIRAAMAHPIVFRDDDPGPAVEAGDRPAGRRRRGDVAHAVSPPRCARA